MKKSKIDVKTTVVSLLSIAVWCLNHVVKTRTFDLIIVGNSIYADLLCFIAVKRGINFVRLKSNNESVEYFPVDTGNIDGIWDRFISLPLKGPLSKLYHEKIEIEKLDEKEADDVSIHINKSFHCDIRLSQSQNSLFLDDEKIIINTNEMLDTIRNIKSFDSQKYGAYKMHEKRDNKKISIFSDVIIYGDVEELPKNIIVTTEDNDHNIGHVNVIGGKFQSDLKDLSIDKNEFSQITAYNIKNNNRYYVHPFHFPYTNNPIGTDYIIANNLMDNLFRIIKPV
jgi:hypothetical protein